jgi:ribokinase
MYRSSEISTGTGLIMLDAEGKNTIVLGGSSGRALTEDEIIQSVSHFPKAMLLMTGFEIPEELALLAARTGKKMGMFTIVNPSPLPERSLESLPFIDLLLVNEVEARGLLFQKDKTLNDRDVLDSLFLQIGSRNIIMTLGERGCLGRDAAGFWEISGKEVSAVDTTGAGDGFGAALAAKLTEGKSVREASLWANAYAAYTVQKMGTIPSYPTKKELEEYLLAINFHDQ